MRFSLYTGLLFFDGLRRTGVKRFPFLSLSLKGGHFCSGFLAAIASEYQAVAPPTVFFEGGVPRFNLKYVDCPPDPLPDADGDPRRFGPLPPRMSVPLPYDTRTSTLDASLFVRNYSPLFPNERPGARRIYPLFAGSRPAFSFFSRPAVNKPPCLSAPWMSVC